MQSNISSLPVDEQYSKKRKCASATLAFRTVISCKPCDYTSGKCYIFGSRLHILFHSNILGTINDRVYAFFGKFVFIAHNAKLGIDDKKDITKLKKLRL